MIKEESTSGSRGSSRSEEHEVWLPFDHLSSASFALEGWAVLGGHTESPTAAAGSKHQEPTPTGPEGSALRNVLVSVSSEPAGSAKQPQGWIPPAGIWQTAA